MSPYHRDAKKCKEINVKSQNDAQRLVSLQSHGLYSAIYNLFLCLTSLQILILLNQNSSSTSFHINYSSFYLKEINQK